MNGFAPESRRESPVWHPIARKQFEVWGFNNDLVLMPYAARWFEMHELNVYGEAAVDDARPDDSYLSALRRGLGIPVYHLRETPLIPGSIEYPLKEMAAKFGSYFTNSFSYMLALAIHEKVDEIHLYGVDMAREHEHGWERPSIEYFLGWARGAGIKVVIPDTSDMLKCLGFYGYGGANPYEIEAASRERLGRLQAEARAYQRDADMMRGAADDLDYWIRRTLLPGDQILGHTNEKAKGRKAWLLSQAKKYAEYGAAYEKAVVKERKR